MRAVPIAPQHRFRGSALRRMRGFRASPLVFLLALAFAAPDVASLTMRVIAFAVEAPTCDGHCDEGPTDCCPPECADCSCTGHGVTAPTLPFTLPKAPPSRLTEFPSELAVRPGLPARAPPLRPPAA